MPDNSTDLRSFSLARSAADSFYAAYIAENCNDRVALPYRNMAQDAFRELAAHLGYRLVPANVVQVGDHPPERSPDTSKIVAIGDHDPAFQRKLDAVATELGGDAA